MPPCIGCCSARRCARKDVQRLHEHRTCNIPDPDLARKGGRSRRARPEEIGPGRTSKRRRRSTRYVDERPQQEKLAVIGEAFAPEPGSIPGGDDPPSGVIPPEEPRREFGIAASSRAGHSPCSARMFSRPLALPLLIRKGCQNSPGALAKLFPSRIAEKRLPRPEIRILLTAPPVEHFIQWPGCIDLRLRNLAIVVHVANGAVDVPELQGQFVVPIRGRAAASG